MSAIDSTFGPIPDPLIKKWGRTVTFHKAGTTESYDPTTGTILKTTTNYTAKAVVTRITAAELTGTLQRTDYKVLITPSQIGGNYVTTADSFSFTRGPKTFRGKVVDVTTLEGDSPVMYVCFVRPE